MDAVLHRFSAAASRGALRLSTPRHRVSAETGAAA
jgi:hypothetical protein